MTTASTSNVRPSIDGFATAMMLMLTFSWGLNQVAIKYSNIGYNPMFVVLLRSMIGGALVFLWCHWRGIDLFKRDGTLGPGIFAGVLFGAEFVLIFIGLEYTSVARATLMINTMPFFVLIGGHFLLGERITLLKLVGLALAFMGVLLVFSDRLSLPGPEAIMGDLLCLGAGFLWAATVLVVKGTKLSQASAEKALLYQLLVSAVFVAPLVLLSGPLLRDVNWLATAAIAYQVVFVVAFTYVLWFWLIRNYPASSLSSFAFLTPVFSAILGSVLLNEKLSVLIFASLGLIAVGLYLVNRPERRLTPG